MSTRAWDTGLGVTFAVVGAALAVAGWRLPEGLANVPGPGVFPLAIGVGLTLLGLALAASGLGVGAAPAQAEAVYWAHGWGDSRLRQVVAILSLLALYVALWDAVPFVWRTPFLLAGIYRVVGEPWLRSILIAAGTTALLVAVFEALLRVRL